MSVTTIQVFSTNYLHGAQSFFEKLTDFSKRSSIVKLSLCLTKRHAMKTYPCLIKHLIVFSTSARRTYTCRTTNWYSHM